MLLELLMMLVLLSRRSLIDEKRLFIFFLLVITDHRCDLALLHSYELFSLILKVVGSGILILLLHLLELIALFKRVGSRPRCIEKRCLRAKAVDARSGVSAIVLVHLACSAALLGSTGRELLLPLQLLLEELLLVLHDLRVLIVHHWVDLGWYLPLKILRNVSDRVLYFSDLSDWNGILRRN